MIDDTDPAFELVRQGYFKFMQSDQRRLLTPIALFLLAELAVETIREQKALQVPAKDTE